VKHKASSSSSVFNPVRIWGWVSLLLLAVLFFYGLAALPPTGDMNPTFHVASRYLDRATEETGFSNSFLAIFLDYRSFDLVLLSLMFLTLTLIVLLFCVVENLSVRSLERGWAFLSLLSSLILLLLGWVGLKDGCNFMDYEFWAGIFGSGARIHGAWITGGLVLMALTASFIWTWKVLILGKEKRFGHQ
jgi:hypothetical protein